MGHLTDLLRRRVISELVRPDRVEDDDQPQHVQLPAWMMGQPSWYNNATSGGGTQTTSPATSRPAAAANTQGPAQAAPTAANDNRAAGRMRVTPQASPAQTAAANQASPEKSSGPATSGRAAAEAYYGKPMNDKEYDSLIRATHAESGGKNHPQEQAMIMGSILNRAKDHPQGIDGALNAKNQFQSVTGTRYQPGPSQNYTKGPNDTRRNSIESAAQNLLPNVPPTQKDFTAASSAAYGKGTNIGYRDQMMAGGGSQYGGTIFRSSMPASQPTTSVAANDNGRPTSGSPPQSPAQVAQAAPTPVPQARPQPIPTAPQPQQAQNIPVTPTEKPMQLASNTPTQPQTANESHINNGARRNTMRFITLLRQHLEEADPTMAGLQVDFEEREADPSKYHIGQNLHPASEMDEEDAGGNDGMAAPYDGTQMAGMPGGAGATPQMPIGDEELQPIQPGMQAQPPQQPMESEDFDEFLDLILSEAPGGYSADTSANDLNRQELGLLHQNGPQNFAPSQFHTANPAMQQRWNGAPAPQAAPRMAPAAPRAAAPTAITPVARQPLPNLPGMAPSATAAPRANAPAAAPAAPAAPAAAPAGPPKVSATASATPYAGLGAALHTAGASGTAKIAPTPAQQPTRDLGGNPAAGPATARSGPQTHGFTAQAPQGAGGDEAFSQQRINMPPWQGEKGATPVQSRGMFGNNIAPVPSMAGKNGYASAPNPEAQRQAAAASVPAAAPAGAPQPQSPGMHWAWDKGAYRVPEPAAQKPAAPAAPQTSPATAAQTAQAQTARPFGTGLPAVPHYDGNLEATKPAATPRAGPAMQTITSQPPAATPAATQTVMNSKDWAMNWGDFIVLSESDRKGF